MATTTTANDESIRQASSTPKLNSNNGTTKKNQTPKETGRKSVNMNDVYSADSPKTEKRKQSATIANDDNDTLPKNKSRTDILIRKPKITVLIS